jgi:hypothetical protein
MDNITRAVKLRVFKTSERLKNNVALFERVSIINVLTADIGNPTNATNVDAKVTYNTKFKTLGISKRLSKSSNIEANIAK